MGTKWQEKTHFQLWLGSYVISMWQAAGPLTTAASLTAREALTCVVWQKQFWEDADFSYQAHIMHSGLITRR